jgi:putative glutamine amidotransferase
MSTPLVGVIGYGLAPGRVTGWDTAAVAVPATYMEALRRAGARPLVIGAPDPGAPEEILQPFDGLVLIGGGDVDPGRYGQARHPDDYGIDPERDSLELDLLLEADRTGLPVLAICRGIQLVNVAFGGSLHQHVPELDGLQLHRGVPDGVLLHDVKVAESSRLHQATGQVTMEVASAHHQAVDELGGGLVPVAWAGDGLIEAIERANGWVVAVQWHPEVTAATDPSQQAIFDGFAEQARGRSGA